MRKTVKAILETLSIDEQVGMGLRQIRNGRRRLGWAWRRDFGHKDRRSIEAYFGCHEVRKLHLGAGNNELEGWLNSDLFPRSLNAIHLDARRPFPLPDASFAFAFSEHMIEHLTYADGLAMLRECHRVLRPGGRLRISTPDLQFLLSLYDRPHPDYIDWQTGWINRDPRDTPVPAEAIFVINNFVRDWGHLFIYDKPCLSDALTLAGFEDLRAFELNESDHPELRDLENESRAPEGLLRLETMTIEGRKLDR